MNDSSCVFEVIYAAVQQSSDRLSVTQMCEIAGVSRSGYYAWVKAALVRQVKEGQDRKDFDLILAAYQPIRHVVIQKEPRAFICT